MRNPKRIQYMMDLITRIWESQPDLRFNQLIHNLQRMYGQENRGYKREVIDEHNGFITTSIMYDLFNVEDNKFTEFLENLIEDLNIDKCNK